MCEDDLSRRLNEFYGGSADELFSSRCYRLRFTSLKWFLLWRIVDQHFARARGERHHCRAAFHRERAERADLDQRARLAGL